ncbi:MAG: DUF4339 domain-containing protein, partial [Clostridia bacterium]|nr:DUF4339 domain-containing protein [Clostridia bacterium]
DINTIELDKDSEEYKELKHITKDITTRQADINIADYEEQLRIRREEGQYAQRMSTRQTNLGAYEAEIRGQVGVAGAQALGKMGENGAGNINLDGNSSGFNPMTIMAGMAVGSAVGQNIAGTLNQSMSNAGQPITPPPIPVVSYFIAKDGKPAGPYDLNTLKTMIESGSLNSENLVWKQGMAEWQKAGEQKDLTGLFPPAIPSP